MYSAATAGYSWGSILFLLPHLLLGAFCVYFGMQGRNIMRTADRTTGLIFQWILGLLFGGVAVFVLSKELVETVVCYRAETAGDGERVSGRPEKAFLEAWVRLCCIFCGWKPLQN